MTVNVAEVAPAGTVTELGNVAHELFDDSETTSPPGPAKPFRVTVPVDETPPATVEGDRESPLPPASETPRYAYSLLLPIAAMIVAVV